MMRLPPFQYVAPKTVAEAVELKAKHGSNAMYVAGGTDLYPKMKRRQFEPEVLIGLRDIEELHGLTNGSSTSSPTPNGIRIGAGMSLTEVANHPEIQHRYPAMAQAASLVSSPQLRNMGTIGGNLCVDTRCTYYDQNFPWRKALGFCMKKDGDVCWVALSSPRCLAVASSDCAPVAIALGAKVHLLSGEGERIIPAEGLYQNDGIDYLEKSPDELLTAIHLPDLAGWRATYWKLRRRGSIDFPILGVAVALKMTPDGTCQEARIVLGAVASSPLLVTEASELLVGEKVTVELVTEVAQVAYKAAKPLDNTDMALSYRNKMVKIYVTSALLEAAGLSELS